jgi:hypothetical protein
MPRCFIKEDPRVNRFFHSPHLKSSLPGLPWSRLPQSELTPSQPILKRPTFRPGINLINIFMSVAYSCDPIQAYFYIWSYSETTGVNMAVEISLTSIVISISNTAINSMSIVANPYHYQPLPALPSLQLWSL